MATQWQNIRICSCLRQIGNCLFMAFLLHVLNNLTVPQCLFRFEREGSRHCRGQPALGNKGSRSEANIESSVLRLEHIAFMDFTVCRYIRRQSAWRKQTKIVLLQTVGDLRKMFTIFSVIGRFIFEMWSAEIEDCWNLFVGCMVKLISIRFSRWDVNTFSVNIRQFLTKFLQKYSLGEDSITMTFWKMAIFRLLKAKQKSLMYFNPWTFEKIGWWHAIHAHKRWHRTFVP